MCRNRYRGQPQFPFVPGYDLVGSVASVGSGVDHAGRDPRRGPYEDGRLGQPRAGARRRSRPVPDGVDPAEAETLVVNGLTAWQMLHRKAAVRPGQTIVDYGANGGVA